MNETERTALARAIRDRRQEMELSARELARRAGVDNATIVLLEQGKIPLPRVDVPGDKDKDKDVNNPNPGAQVKYTYRITKDRKSVV